MSEEEAMTRYVMTYVPGRNATPRIPKIVYQMQLKMHSTTVITNGLRLQFKQPGVVHAARLYRFLHCVVPGHHHERNLPVCHNDRPRMLV